MNQPADVIEPVRRSVEVSCPARDAFRIFIDEIDAWWPLSTHSIGQEHAVSCFFEGEEGGRVYETHGDGSIHLWGTVTDWDPPSRVVFTWHPGRDERTAKQVELRFIEHADRTVVELEHRGWEKLGEQASKIREGYHSGWQSVLAKYVARCDGV